MQILIIDGPDGAGKSTLIKAAAEKLDWPDDLVLSLPRKDMVAYWKRHPEEATLDNVLEHVAREMCEHCKRMEEQGHELAVFDRGWPSTAVYQDCPNIFDRLPQYLQETPTLVYLTTPSLAELMVRKAQRDGVGVGSGMSNDHDTAEVHRRYRELRPGTNVHFVKWDEGPSVDELIYSVKLLQGVLG